MINIVSFKQPRLSKKRQYGMHYLSWNMAIQTDILSICDYQPGGIAENKVMLGPAYGLFIYLAYMYLLA